MNSGSHPTQGGGGGHEHPFGLFLYDCHEGVHFLDPLFSQLERSGELLICRGDCLADLLHVNTNRCRDVVHVVGDRARVPHYRIDVTINPVEHVAHLRVALSKIPGGRNERDRKNQQCDRSEATCVSSDLFEGRRFGLDLPRDDRVGMRGCSLKQPLRPGGQPYGHARDVCKGKAIRSCRRSERYKECYSQYISATASVFVHGAAATESLASPVS